jgi:hypothetical protein
MPRHKARIPIDSSIDLNPHKPQLGVTIDTPYKIRPGDDKLSSSRLEFVPSAEDASGINLPKRVLYDRMANLNITPAINTTSI